MATVRQQVADRIRTDNPTYRVNVYPDEPDNVDRERPYVDVYLTDLANNPDVTVEHTLKIDCYASRTFGSEAEDEAETIRDNVLLSIQRLDNVQWSTCQRSSFGDPPRFIGYQITATFTSNHVYADAVRQES